jgi:putative transport protein
VFTFISQALHDSPNLVFFLVLGLGYVLGKARIGTFDLGPVAGVLFVGIIFGHFGYGEFGPVGSIGFILFIYSIGTQAGPKFFTVIKEDGLRYFTLALVIAFTGFSAALGMSKLFGLAPGASAGILAGGLTSYTAGEVITNITTGYAITYVFGLVGLIMIIRLLPKFMGVNLVSEAEKLAGPDEETIHVSDTIVTRAFQVTKEDLVGIKLSKIYATAPGVAALLAVKRDGEFLEVGPDTEIRIGDRISVVGYLARVPEAAKVIGPEIIDDDLLEIPVESCRIVVTKSRAAGQAVVRSTIVARYGCVLSKISRVGVDISLDAPVTIERGDVLFVTGPQANLELLGADFGHIEREVNETDLITLALGIACGIFLGTLTVKVGGVSIGLGTAGGLLTAGLVIGFLRSIHPTFGRVPSAARWLFMEMGLLFFMAGIGLRAGSGIVTAITTAGPSLLLSGVIVTTAPVAVGLIVGRYLLKINIVLLLGGVTGSMTSGACLSIVTSEAKSQVPALGYTGAYAFSNVLLTVAGSLILTL